MIFLTSRFRVLMRRALFFGSALAFSFESSSIDTINKIIAKRPQPQVKLIVIFFSSPSSTHHFISINHNFPLAMLVCDWKLYHWTIRTIYVNKYFNSKRRLLCLFLLFPHTQVAISSADDEKWWKRTTWKIYGFPNREDEFFSCYQTQRLGAKTSPLCLRSLLLHAIFAFFDSNIKFIMMIRDWNVKAHFHCPPLITVPRKIPFVNISHHHRETKVMMNDIHLRRDLWEFVFYGKIVDLVPRNRLTMETLLILSWKVDTNLPTID